LEEYINSPTRGKKRDLYQEYKSPFLSRWIKWDLDIYVGAIGSAVALLVIGCLTFVKGGLGSSEIANPKLQRSQFSASIIIFLGCLFNLWLVRRRRFSTAQGSDSLKRREISRFLKEVEKQEEESLKTQCDSGGIIGETAALNLAGNSLTDIYPVYRRNQGSDGSISGGSWSRIPTLLLVRGDHIALQVGDMAPAACRVVVEDHMADARIEAGERITLDILDEKSGSVIGKLPKGKTTLPKDSDELLALCNNMRIFELLESPLEIFLRQPRGKLVLIFPPSHCW
jgi:hypothetical protein